MEQLWLTAPPLLFSSLVLTFMLSLVLAWLLLAGCTVHGISVGQTSDFSGNLSPISLEYKAGLCNLIFWK